MTEDRLAELMVKAADGLARPEELEELMQYTDEHPELDAELRSHRALGVTTNAWVQRLVLDETEDRWTDSAGTRVERGLGLGLLVGGVALLSGFAFWELWLDPEAPTWLKLGTSMTLAGLLVLTASALRWKWLTRDDPYDEVIR